MPLSLNNLHLTNINSLCTPPNDWAADVQFLGETSAAQVHLSGDSPDCREAHGTVGMTYRVVTGDTIAIALPWLMNFYRLTLAGYISQLLPSPIVACASERYGVNINILQSKGDCYEWHVDPSPVAAVLFVTAHPPGCGGELALRIGDDERHVHPEKGLIAIFEGRAVQHAVLPLREDTSRISIPMLYYHAGEPQYFPQDLDRYLYGT
jgi:hypothetical protein